MVHRRTCFNGFRGNCCKTVKFCHFNDSNDYTKAEGFHCSGIDVFLILSPSIPNCMSFYKFPSLPPRIYIIIGPNLIGFSEVTRWGRMTDICVIKQTIIGSNNGLSPGRCQAIIWTNAGILLIGPQGTKFNEISIKIHTFSFKEMHLQMSYGKWRPFCLGLNVIYCSRTLHQATFHQHYITGIWPRIRNHIYCVLSDAIDHPRSIFNGGLV